MEPMSTPGSILLLTRLARVVYRAGSEDVIGMPLKQYSLLVQLRDRGGTMAQQDLVGSLHLDPNIVVLLLNDVEAAGYAERKRDPRDRRRHIVELTTSGRRAVEKAEKGLESVEDEVLSALSLDERADLHRLLTRALEPEQREADGSVPALSAEKAAAKG